MSLLSSLFLVPPPISLPLTLCTLDDDSLLLLFSTLALPHLLTLRGVSRRFAYLIERYTLPKWRTLLYGYSKAEKKQRGKACGVGYTGPPQVVDLYFSRSVHPYTDFCQGFGGLCTWNIFGPSHEPFYRQPRQVHRTVLRSLPASLPRLLPNLASLTFTQFHGTDSELSEEQLTVNSLLAGYLQSSWSTSLVSLHLYLEVGWFRRPVDPFPLQALSQLVGLRHLQLQLCVSTYFALGGLSFLPDSLPVLGQLISFGLHRYHGTNVPLLLHQLGPNLVSLSLNQIACSVADLTAFLRARPNCQRTLRILELRLQGGNLSDQEFSLICQFLPSFERFHIDVSLQGSLYRLLLSLRPLVHLRELTTLWMSLHQLRALRDNSPREGLPQLPSIRTLDCHIVNWVDRENQLEPLYNFAPDELFLSLLPLLANTFTHLQDIQITCSTADGYEFGSLSGQLSQQLTAKVKELFPHLLSCKATYYA